MIKFITFFLLLSITSVLHAYDDDDEDIMGNEKVLPLKAVVDVSKYNPTPLSIKKSILKIVIKNNWVITEHKKNIILAKYRTGAKIKITIQPTGIVIEEIKNNARFTQKWLRSLKDNFVKNIILEYHVNIAKTYLNIK